MVTSICLAAIALILFAHGTFQPSSFGVIFLEALGLVVSGITLHSLHEQALRHLCRNL